MQHESSMGAVHLDILALRQVESRLAMRWLIFWERARELVAMAIFL